MYIPPSYNLSTNFVIASRNRSFNKGHLIRNHPTLVISGKPLRDAMSDTTEEYLDTHSELVRKLKYWLSINSRTVIADANEVGIGELISIRQDPELSNAIKGGKFYLQTPFELFSSVVLELTNDVDWVIRTLQSKAKSTR